MATAEKALAASRRRGTKLWECYSHLALARSLMRFEGPAARNAIESALDEFVALVRATGAVALEPCAYEERANLARLLGDEAARRRELGEAHCLFTKMGATGHAERLGVRGT